jgi:hypothetical protein
MKKIWRSPVVKWGFRILLFLGVVGTLIVLGYLRHGLYNRYVRFPKEAKAWAAIQKDRAPITLISGWNEYRGVCHSHSELSHDSEVPFEDILQTLKDTDRDFMYISDHCDEDKANFGVQWRGLKDGKLFVPGFEMGYGFMPFGLPSDVVLKKSTPPKELAKQIVDAGGLLFFAHTEEDREWDLPELTGMEIYNIHTDFSDDGESIAKLLPDVICSQRSYPDHIIRTIFDRQIPILENWDRLNKTRKIVGIAGNDCHQNNGFRGWYTEKGTFRIEDTSPDTLGEWDLNFVTRGLLRVAFGPLQTEKPMFHFQLDPYERMVRYVSTHVLAEELTEEAVSAALRMGRVFVGFDMLADARGFVWMAEGPDGKCVMGESLPFSEGVTLRAAAPHQGRFTVLRDGAVQHQSEGRSLDWTPSESGKYRVEVDLMILDEWTPWIYANPIELTE